MGRVKTAAGEELVRAVPALIGAYVLVMGWPDLATAAAMSVDDIYKNGKEAITGIYGALFSLGVVVVGTAEYFMNGRNLGHLMGFIIIALFPHIAVTIIDKIFGLG
ncbi:MAG: type IV conjugative transfer system pilin TraA [Thermodesulfovibrionales bacterium]